MSSHLNFYQTPRPGWVTLIKNANRRLYDLRISRVSVTSLCQRFDNIALPPSEIAVTIWVIGFWKHFFILFTDFKTRYKIDKDTNQLYPHI